MFVLMYSVENCLYDNNIWGWYIFYWFIIFVLEVLCCFIVFFWILLIVLLVYRVKEIKIIFVKWK